MSTHIRANAYLIGATLVLCAIAYPLVLWIVGCAFPTNAAGSIVRGADGKPAGSSLIAQEFKGDEYFQPRPSAASYNASASSGSNLGANSPKLRDRVSRQLGSIVKYRDGKPVGPDVEKWFQEKPDRLADWAKSYSTLAGVWVTADPLNTEFVKQWLKDHEDLVAGWKKEHADATDEPKPEDLAVEFFSSFAAANPKTIPSIVEKKVGETVEKKVQPVGEGGDVQGWFFDMWLQEHANEAATIEPVPADMVTTSGSGLDPHITLRSARYQLDRVATAWAEKKKLDPTKDQTKIEAIRTEIGKILNDPKRSFVPLSGLAGEPLVNVLELNLEVVARMNGL